MTKIGLYLDTEGAHGGVHQYAMAVTRALENLPQEKYNVIGICENEEWADFCKEHGIQYYNTEKVIQKNGVFSFVLSLVKTLVLRIDILELRAHEIEYVIFPSVTPNMLFVKRPICAIHDLMHRYEKRFPEMCSLYQYILRDVLFRLIARRSVAVLTDSSVGKKHVEECYLSNIEDKRVKILPFIAPDYIYEYKNFEPDDNWMDIESKLPERYFFYPAQFWKHKNHITILKAFQKLTMKYPDMNLVFVGSRKNACKEIDKFICSNGLGNRIHIYGYVSKYSMIQLYKRACALIMASCCGPTNIPQLEAFVLGCPVIVADVYAVKEQVSDAALLFQPEDADSLSKHMELLWVDNTVREKLIQNGFHRNKQYGQSQFTDFLVEIVEEVTSENNSKDE